MSEKPPTSPIASWQPSTTSRMLLDEPARAQSAAGLLVRGEDQPDRAPRRRSGAGPSADDAEHHGVEVLHVHRAAAPDAAVDHLAGERGHRPVVGVWRARRRGGRGSAAAAASVSTPSGSQCATTDVRPRLGLEQLAGDAHLVEQLCDVLGGLALTRTFVPSPKLEVSIRISSWHRLDNLGFGQVIRAHRVIFAHAIVARARSGRTLRQDHPSCYSSWAPREEQPQVRVAE